MTTLNSFEVSGSNGAIWGTETADLNATLVRWNQGQGVATHINQKVDVVMVVLSGEGKVWVDGVCTNLNAGMLIVLLKGSERRILATSEDLTYLNVHRRSHGLMPNMARPE